MKNLCGFAFLFTRILRNLCVVLLFCEFLIYYVVIAQCRWPNIKKESVDDGLKTIILADTHMLGPFRGHPFDKLRREWQMRRSFQTAIQLFKPDVVLILGDIFDEGNWVNDRQFDEYVDRFKSIFEVPQTTKLYAIHGNHDINFHYQMHPYLINRFNRAFNSSGVRLIREKKKIKSRESRILNFVSINSMAMEGDGCTLCNEAEFNIKSIEKKLNELKTKDRYSQPIVLQHFPTFRTSDEQCSDTNSLNKDKYREKWDTVSKESTRFINQTLQPRVYFSGHSHHYCRLSKNSVGVEEFTLASFNWRNINNPSFILAVFTPTEHSVSLCEMPKETTVLAIYVIGAILSLVTGFCGLGTFKSFYRSKLRQKKSKETE